MDDAPPPRRIVQTAFNTIELMRTYLLLAAMLASWIFAAAHAQPTPRMLVEMSDIGSVSVSPNGALVAFREEAASIERNTYDTTWYVQAIAAGTPAVRVSDGGVPLRISAGSALNEPPQWSPDSRWIYYRAFHDGEVQVWRAAIDGGRSEPVTRDDADVETFLVGDDGRSVLYMVRASRAEIERAELDEYHDGILIDHTVPIGSGLFRSSWINGRLATARYTGYWMRRAGLLHDRPLRHFRVDLGGGAATEIDAGAAERFASRYRPAVGRGMQLSERALAVGDGGRTAFLAHNGRSAELRVAEDRLGRRERSCNQAECRNQSIQGIAWRAGTNEVVFTASSPSQRYAQALYAWDTTRNTIRLIVQSDGLLAGERTGGRAPCALSRDFAVCVAASAQSPPRVERIDLDSGERVVLFDPNATLRAIAEWPVELLEWTDDAGRRFSGHYLPARGAQRPSPLFITYYACPGYLRGGMGDEWPLATLASVGIAAICINQPVRDATIPDQVTGYEVAAAGIEAVVGILAARGEIDSERIGMGGLSFGTEAVMWMLMHSDMIAAASVSSASISPTYYWFHAHQGPSFRDSFLAGWSLGEPAATPDQWRRMSPAYSLDSIAASLLMQLPEREYIQTVDYVIPLMVAGHAVEMYVFPDEAHIKFQPRHKLAAYERNLDWFRFWLQNHEDASPTKAKQYARWRDLGAKRQAPSTAAPTNAEK